MRYTTTAVVLTALSGAALRAQPDDGSKDVNANTRNAEDSDALSAALRELEGAKPAADDGGLWSKSLGTPALRLIDLSADLLFAAGGSSERDESLATLQGGGHDPRKRGFTLQNLEVSMLGAVDPYFNAEIHLVYFIDPLEGESILEIEEAFVTSSSLPFGLDEHGLQVEAGLFFTEFGRINPRHPHAWDWIDAPVINTRLFGPDGMRGLGARAGWLLPLPWFGEVHAGIQNANGETMASFLANDEFVAERAPGGRPFAERDVRGLEDFVYLLRLDNGVDLTETLSAKLGGSFLSGPNSSGLDGTTAVYGLDLVLKWRPLSTERGWPFVIWQSEVLQRRYRADDAIDEGDDPVDPADDTLFASDSLYDHGAYSQLLWGFRRNWVAGLRAELAGGSGASLGEFSSRDEDPFRDERYRISPLVVWHPTEYSRLRLQYNWDHADHLASREAHSIWFGFEVLLGKHPVHEY